MQLNDLEEFYKLERFHLGEEVLCKEKEIQKMREDYEESHRQLCQKLRTEQSEIQNQVGHSNGEQQHQEALYDHLSSDCFESSQSHNWNLHHPENLVSKSLEHLVGGKHIAIRNYCSSNLGTKYDTSPQSYNNYSRAGMAAIVAVSVCGCDPSENVPIHFCRVWPLGWRMQSRRKPNLSK